MNKLLVFVCCFWLVQAGMAQGTSTSMTLDEAINYAIKNQPAFQNYVVEQQISAAKRLQSVSAYIPKLTGSANLQNNLKLPIVALKFPNPITGADENLKIQQGTTYQSAASIDLTVPLVDPTAIGDLKYTRQQRNLSDLQLQQAVIDLKVNVSKAYYLVLLNGERVKKIQQTLERDQKAYDDTKVKYDNQSALKSDMNRAYLNLQNTKYQMKLSQDSVKTSTSNLAQLVGLPIGSTLTLTDVLPMQVKEESIPEYPDFKTAEQNRIEIRTEQMQETMNKLLVRKTNFGYIPTLSGYGSLGGLGLDNSNLFQKSSWYWNDYIGLRLSVPIFDGLQKMAIAQQQKLAIKKNENNINNLKETVNYQLQTSSVNYINGYENLRLIQENVKLAEDVVKEVNTRYQNSMATYQEVLDAENTLKDTNFNYLQALYAFLLADLDWKKANGKL